MQSQNTENLNSDKGNFIPAPSTVIPAKAGIQAPAVLLILLFGIILLVFGIFLGKTYFSGKQSSNVVPTSIVSAPITTVATSGAEMANWKTYKNGKYGFELKYPALLHEIDSGFLIDCCGPRGEIGLEIKENISMSIEDWWNNEGVKLFDGTIRNDRFHLQAFETLTREKAINGKTWFTISAAGVNQMFFSVYILKMNNNLFIFTNEDSNDYQDETFSQILSTFKFL